MWREEVGSKGGKETLKRYGRSWMKELGKRGLRATADKYFAGSVAECMSYLRNKAAELQWLAAANFTPAAAGPPSFGPTCRFGRPEFRNALI